MSIIDLFYQDLITLSKNDLQVLAKYLKVSGKTKTDLATKIAKRQASLYKKAHLISGQICQNDDDLLGESIEESDKLGKVVVYTIPGTNTNYCFTIEDIYGIVSSGNMINPYTREAFSQAFIQTIQQQIVPSEIYAQVVQEMTGARSEAETRIPEDLNVLNRVMDAYPYLNIAGIQAGKEDPNLLAVMRNALKIYIDISDDANYNDIILKLGQLTDSDQLEDWGLAVSEYLLTGQDILPQVIEEYLNTLDDEGVQDYLFKKLEESSHNPIKLLMQTSKIPTNILLSLLKNNFIRGLEDYSSLDSEININLISSHDSEIKTILNLIKNDPDVYSDIQSYISYTNQGKFEEAGKILISIFIKLLKDHSTENRQDAMYALDSTLLDSNWDAIYDIIGDYQNKDFNIFTIILINKDEYNPLMWYTDENGVYRRKPRLSTIVARQPSTPEMSISESESDEEMGDSEQPSNVQRRLF